MFQQDHEYLKRLAPQSHPHPGFAQFPRMRIRFKNAETDEAGNPVGERIFHFRRLRKTEGECNTAIKCGIENCKAFKINHMPGDTTGIERELTFVVNPQKPVPANGSLTRFIRKGEKMRTKSNIFRAIRSGRFFALVALVGLSLLSTASGVRAGGCALTSKMGTASSLRFVSPHSDNDQEGENSNLPRSIVGLWHLNYTAETESGAPIFPPVPFLFAETFKMWHADGTEFENAVKPPTGNNICYGVWRDLGNGSVKLHHIGLMFDSMGNLSNIFTVDEKNTVARNGKTYSGTFDFKLWPPSFEAVGVGTPIAEATGSTSATRITVD